jgi:hypothetical protein
VRLALTLGDANDNRLAGKLLSRLKSARTLLAGRGHDADWIRGPAIRKVAWRNNPPKSDRRDPICCSPGRVCSRASDSRINDSASIACRMSSAVGSRG